MFSRRSDQRLNPAQRRYLWRFLPAMTIYSVVVVAAGNAIGRHQVQGVALVILSILPSLPLLVAIMAVGLYLTEETDEYIRVRAMIGSLGGTGLVLAVGTVWGFLEQGGVVPHVPAWFVFPLWAIGLGMTQGILAFRDRSGGQAA